MKVTNRAQLYTDTIKFIAGTADHEDDLRTLFAVVAPRLAAEGRSAVPGLAALLKTSKDLDQDFQDGKAARCDAFAAQRNAKETAQAWITTTRIVLVPYLSRNWSERWAQAGWIAPGSTATPDSIPQILDLTERLQRFLKANTRYENADPDVNVTTVRAKAIFDTLGQCVADVNKAKSGQRVRREAREAADTKLVEKLQSGRKALEIDLKPEDARWLDFINQVPADLERPEVPEDVEAEPGLPGRITVRCEPSERAESYEFEVLVVGVDSEFRSAATTQDPVMNLTLPAGKRVKVRVIARNSTGPSAASEVVEITVPQSAAA